MVLRRDVTRAEDDPKTPRLVIERRREVLHHLTRPKTEYQLAELTRRPTRQVHATLRALQNCGLVQRFTASGQHTRVCYLRYDVDARRARRAIRLEANQQRLLAHLDQPLTAAELARRTEASLGRTVWQLNRLAEMDRVRSAFAPGMRIRRCYWRAGIDIDPETLRAKPNAGQTKLLRLLGEPRTVRWLAERIRTNPVMTQVLLERLCEMRYAIRTDLPGPQLPRVFYGRYDITIDIRDLQTARQHQRLLSFLRKPRSIAAVAQNLGVSQQTAASKLMRLIESKAACQLSSREGTKPALYCRVDSIPLRLRQATITARRRRLLEHLGHPQLLQDLAKRIDLKYHVLVYELETLRRHRSVRKLRLGGNKHAVAFCRTGTAITSAERLRLRHQWSRSWVESLRAAAQRSKRRRR